MTRGCRYESSCPVPSEGQSNTATPAVRYQEAVKSFSKPLQVQVESKKDNCKASDVSTANTSLFQQSSAKLGPLAQSSLSFSSDISDGTTGFPERRSLGVSSARLSRGGARRSKGNRSVTHSNTTPSMAQLRARKIMSEAQETKTHRSHSIPISPTSEGSDWEETSTDISSIVDLETVAHVSHFIDSLQKRSLTVPPAQSSPISPTQVGISLSIPAVTDPSQCHFRAETTTRYQSSLVNARNAMAASPIAKSFTPRSEPTPRRANFTMDTGLDADEFDGNPVDEDSHLVQERTKSIPSRCPNVPSHLFEPPHKNQVPETYVKSTGDQLSPTGSPTTRRDVHYYAILAQIQKVVRSDNASMSLGKILADANKRGMSLDVVTEIYKRERFKVSAQKASYNDDKTTDKPWGSLKVVNDDKSDQEEANSDSPEGPSSSSPRKKEDNQINCGKPATQGHKIVKTSISGEIADDMVELSRLCDQATALFNENLIGEESYLSNASDVVTKVITLPNGLSHGIFDHNDTSFAEDDQCKIKAEGVSDNSIGNFRGNHSAPLVQDRNASIYGVHGQSFDRHTYDQLMADALPKIKAGTGLSEVLANARRKGLPTTQLVELYKKECLVTTRGDIIDTSSVDVIAKNEEPIVNQVKKISPLNEKLNGQDDLASVLNDCGAEFGIPGLNELQLFQLKHLVKKAEDSREVDLSPQFCIDDSRRLSLGYTGNSESSSALPAGVRRNANLLGHEDIDAFFSRFSIQKDGEPFYKHTIETSPCTTERKVWLDTECSAKCIKLDCSELSGNSEKEPDDVESQSQGCVGKIILKDSGAQSVCLEEASHGAEDEGVWEEPSVATERKSKLKYQSGEGNNNLPKHLGLWKSPWQRNHIARTSGFDIFKPDPTAGIVSGGTFSRKKFGGKRRQCSLSLDKRLMGHTGYLNIDFYSLYESTVVQAEDEDIDQAPWEYRDVGQRFLHEKSLESRNWFGSFEIKRGNDRVPNPVCRPKSLQVSVTKIPEPGEWNEDWYTTWKSRKDNPNNLVTFAQDETVKMSESQYFVHSTKCHEITPILKKVVVEIGSLCPVRVRGGERVSRIHPEFTSSLRQSRWRKKYLKGSLFPSD
eukprot:CAMPEP_0201915510 /NCGR_PEP_ID=MMETSP0903-20130614/5400_1 /ASSEMBLY_ACC=CAM_ASM_000552 /TAXON_ID=420261 /ORGANISM="Thalassiosira antarctica, Strain CCMP982" /LENGTH=1105 /DNA_ID=CAMNT_0048451127 /DNA_START=34 /DNA_END=3354 /DNA_ORIENTATION=-